MDESTIDVELEHYVGDRLATNNREALHRLYLRAITRYSGAVLTDYLERLAIYARVYASISHQLRQPTCHIEVPLFLSSLTLLLAGIVLMVNGEFSPLIACSTSAAIVGMIRCGLRYFHLWVENCVREAVFLELATSLLAETTATEFSPAG